MKDTARSRPLRLGVLLSGTGRTLENLLTRQRKGRLPVEITCVLSSRADVRGCQVARDAGLPLVVCLPRDHPDPAEYGAAIAAELRRAEVELVAMAGFLHLWAIPEDLKGRVMNVHPALLPSFGGRGCYGHRVHRAVLESGVKVSGCTVHFADDEYDHGPIILQRTVKVDVDDDADSLAAKVFDEECRAYPKAIRWFAAGRLRIEGHRVRVLS